MHVSDVKADGLATTPLQTVIDCVVPQLYVPGVGYSDLHDRERRLVVECDSFQFHSGREAVVNDVERYNACELGGYALLRFAWEQAMRRQDYVRDCFGSFLEHDGLAVRAGRPPLAA